MKSIYSYVIPSVGGSTSLSTLTDTNIQNPQNNQILKYQNGFWINSNVQTAAVESVFGRTGNVVGQNNDYSISQIQNSSFLANSTNVYIAPLLTQGETIRYNGSQYVNSKLALNDLSNVTATNTNNTYLFNNGLNWINKTLSGVYNEEVIAINQIITADLNKIYFLSDSTLNVFSQPIFQNTGASILIISNAGTNNNVIGSGLSFFWDNQAYANVNLSCFSYGVLELIWSYTGGFYINPICGRWYSSTNNKYLAMNYLQDLNNVTISTPVNNQVLTFNGGIWANSNPLIQSVFGRTGNVVAQNNDYSITQITNSSTLADSTNVNLILPFTGEILSYNGSQWTNIKRTASFQLNSDGNLANNNFIYMNGYGQTNTEFRAQILLPYNITLTEINISLTASPAGTRIFSIRTNGNIQTNVSMTGTQTTLSRAINIPCTSGQLLSLQNTAVGANNAVAIINIKYFFN